MRVTRKGRPYVWSFGGCRVLGTDGRPRSALHVEARRILAELYPRTIIYEEVLIPGTRLRFDFVVPYERLAVEVQGRQHFEYVEHFHKSKAGFVTARLNDLAKAEFCEENAIRLVALKYSETPDEWRSAIAQGTG